MTTRSHELSDAMSRLIDKQPFFATLLLDLLQVKESAAGEEGFPVPTAGVDGKHLWINRQWFANLTIDERVFVLIHEVMHLVLSHVKRGNNYLKRGIGPDMKAYNPMKMNHAMDYIINDWVIKSGNKSMPVGGLLNPQYGMNDIADEVYCKLPDPKPDPNKQGGSGNGDGNWDTHMPEADGAVGKADMQRAMKSAAATAKARGKVPAGMEQLVDQICEPQVDWAEQLRLSVVTAAGRDSATWARPNRRRMAVPPHVYFPGTCSHKAGRVVVYGDTSGSISSKEWGHFFGEVAAIVDELNPEECWLGSCDSQAHDPVLIEQSQDVLDYKPEGGGGTHMPAIFDKLAELDLRPEVLVILTDGYTAFGEPPGYEVVWVMTTGETAPFGRNLRIKVTN